MSQKKGVKDLSELIVGGFSLTGIFIKHLKDGFDPTDPVKIFLEVQADPEFKDAIQGISNVPGEFADIDLSEIFELTTLSINEARKLILGILGR